MLFLAISILGLLSAVNYIIGSKSLFYPPFVFSSVWMLALVLVWISGDFFYPLSPLTLVIFCIGCIVFSVGSTLALLFTQKAKPDQRLSPRASRVLTVLVLLSVVAIPFCYRWVTSLSSQSGVGWLAGIVVALTDTENQGGLGWNLFNEAIGLATTIAMIAFCEMERGKKRFVIALAAALVLDLMTASRSRFTYLIFALVCLDWLKNHRVRWKALLVLGLIFIVAFNAIAIYVGKAAARPDASLAENAKPLVEGFVLYAGGPLVAFDRVVREPGIVEHNWNINRFFLQFLNMLGARFEIPVLHADYVKVGPDWSQNVYTIYFAYMDFGYVGMMALMLGLGFVITLCYKNALNGNKSAMLAYSMLFSGIVTSIFFELFFLNFSALVRLYALSWLLYRLPRIWSGIRGAMRTELPSDLGIGELPGRSRG